MGTYTPQHFFYKPRLGARGYVQKPIVGRCGANISLFDAEDRVIEETSGRFDSPYQVFQELFPLPVIDGDFVQLCTFSAGGTYGGTCVRVDPSMVITTDSDIVALRVVNDKEFLEDFASPEEGYQI